jgi:hypothetical protein
VRRTNLQIASLLLLLTQLTWIDSKAQAVLVRTLNDRDQPRLEEKPEPTPGPNVLSSTSPEESINSSAARWAPKPLALSSNDPQKFGLIDLAYLDAFTILIGDNSCSRFFGGPHATSALTELVRQLKPRNLDSKIAIRMSGQITTVQSNATGFAFRLFDKAELNLAGSFFRNRSATDKRFSISPIYAANTRETRVVVLLHELGHLVKTPDRRWVLADDGDNPVLSLKNTEQIISVCRKEIDSLSAFTPAQEFAMTKPKPTPEERH